MLNMKHINKYIYVGLLAAGLSACSDEEMSQVPSAIVPSSVTFNLSDDLSKLVYTDATGAMVLPMIKGETAKLDYTMVPDSATFKDVEWTSSNEAVATVDNGVVTAVSGDDTGYSMIQVAPLGLYAGSGINAIIKVAVSNQMVKATDVVINSSADELYAGDTLHLSTTIMPENATYKTVKWSCSDESIATISSDGILTAKTSDKVKATVTIKATTFDGSNIVGTKDILVRQIVQPLDVTIDNNFNGMACAINEKSLKLTYTTVPEECTTSLIEWTSSDESIATVDKGVVKYNQSGNFGKVTITATCRETGKTSSVELNLEAGLIRETFENKDSYTWWNAKQSANGTSSSHVWKDNHLTITTYMQNATTGRADIKCWEPHTWFHAGNYPIFAFRMDDVKDIEGSITSRNINIDAVGTSASGTQYKAIANGNNKYLHDYKCSDGSHVFIYDLATQACGTGGLMPTNETVDFTTLQIKHADMKNVDHQIKFNLYWIQTFKTMEDLVKYIESEGLTYEVIK